MMRIFWLLTTEECSVNRPLNIASNTGLRDMSTYLWARTSTEGSPGGPTSKQTSVPIAFSSIYSLHSATDLPICQPILFVCRSILRNFVKQYTYKNINSIQFTRFLDYQLQFHVQLLQYVRSYTAMLPLSCSFEYPAQQFQNPHTSLGGQYI